jgi:ribosomal protein S18 acetylase RimI-like enzyme
VILRDAIPGTADARAVAWDLETATDRMFSLMLGSRWEPLLTAVVAQPGHAWSVERARVAEGDGELLGVLLGGPADTPEPDDSLGLPWGLTRLRLMAVGMAFQPFLSFMHHHDPGEWYVTAVSVTPEARGRGVGAALLEDAVARARDAGMASIALDVDAKNSGARRLYERHGFVVTGTSSAAWLAGGVRVQRMRRILQTAQSSE